MLISIAHVCYTSTVYFLLTDPADDGLTSRRLVIFIYDVSSASNAHKPSQPDISNMKGVN
jgi:hypothetical protein